jgi:non-homologous end joining protein Ku
VIEDEKVPKDMLELAVHIVESKKGKFEPEKFEDEYENAAEGGFCARNRRASGSNGRKSLPVPTSSISWMLYAAASPRRNVQRLQQRKDASDNDVSLAVIDNCFGWRTNAQGACA